VIPLLKSVPALQESYGSHCNDAELEAERGYAREQQPISQYRAMAGIPLLILNGEADDIVPISAAQEFARLLQMEPQGELVKAVFYPGVGHEIKLEMELEAIRWMKQQLGNGGQL